jgi:hypothetical protein
MKILSAHPNVHRGNYNEATERGENAALGGTAERNKKTTVRYWSYNDRISRI